MGIRTLRRALAAAALTAAAFVTPATAFAETAGYATEFDKALGTEVRTPMSVQAVYDTSLEARIARVADGSKGRIGVAAIDLSTGRTLAVLGDQRFPMASTSKVAIAATFLEGVEKGRWSLTSEFPLLIPQASARFSTKVAPVNEGQHYKAVDLIEMMITRSSNPATDALLRVVGGPAKVTDWARRNGIANFSIDRDIATLVRDDGEFNPANHVDLRDSATPLAMAQLLAKLYQGKVLNASSRRVLLGAMSRTVTGKHRIRGLMPASVRVSHKTGTLSNTASDIGILELPDGRAVALAIYVTGQGSKPARDAKIAEIALAVHNGLVTAAPNDGRNWASASYGSGGKK